MRILIIKTSSLGDVVHMLPAVSDAAHCCPKLSVDWVVEEHFSAIPSWHPRVDRVLPVALRPWRKALAHPSTWRQIRDFRGQLKGQDYVAVIDGQGLYKSALVASWARGPRWGYDRHSAKEPLTTWVYHRTVRIPRELHAIERNRRLLAAVLGYQLDGLPLDYGLMDTRASLPMPVDLPRGYIVGLHGTSRAHKEWPLSHWQELGHWLHAQGFSLLLPWGNPNERKRAECIARAASGVTVLPSLELNALAAVLVSATVVVGVDTGLTHVAAALGCPGLALYVATSPDRTGVLVPRGVAFDNLAGAEALNIEAVKRRLLERMAARASAAQRIS